MNRQAGPSIVISVLIVCFFAVALFPRDPKRSTSTASRNPVSGSVASVQPDSLSKDAAPPAVGKGDRPSAISGIHSMATAKESSPDSRLRSSTVVTVVDDGSRKPKRDLAGLKPGPGQGVTKGLESSNGQPSSRPIQNAAISSSTEPEERTTATLSKRSSRHDSNEKSAARASIATGISGGSNSPRGGFAVVASKENHADVADHRDGGIGIPMSTRPDGEVLPNRERPRSSRSRVRNPLSLADPD